VRSLRQKEYDNASLYSETDAEQAEQLERSRFRKDFQQFMYTLPVDDNGIGAMGVA